MRKLKYLWKLSKPGIVRLVGFTTFGGAILGFQETLDLARAFIVTILVMLSASGSSLINNYLDRHIDSLMERTRYRIHYLQEVDGKLVPAVGLLLILSSLVGTLIMFNMIAFVLNLVAVVSYAGIYTLYLKRRTPFAAIIGGVPGALPPVIGYTAITGKLDPMSIVLFAFMFLWQPAHFLFLAMMLKEDYRKAGIPVMPLVYGQTYTKSVILVYSTSLVPVSLLPYLFGYLDGIYVAFAIVLGTIWLVLIALYMLRKLSSHLFMFVSSNFYVLLVFSSMILDRLIYLFSKHP